MTDRETQLNYQMSENRTSQPDFHTHLPRTTSRARPPPTAADIQVAGGTVLDRHELNSYLELSLTVVPSLVWSRGEYTYAAFFSLDQSSRLALSFSALSLKRKQPFWMPSNECPSQLQMARTYCITVTWNSIVKRRVWPFCREESLWCDAPVSKSTESV